jgi:hypothetical protein
MSARPAIRPRDLKTAHEAEILFGRPVHAISRGDVTIFFGAPGQSDNDDEAGRALAALEARYG